MVSLAPEWLGTELLDEDYGVTKWLAYLAAWVIFGGMALALFVSTLALIAFGVYKAVSALL